VISNYEREVQDVVSNCEKEVQDVLFFVDEGEAVVRYASSLL
jgi:hypothetical protein